MAIAFTAVIALCAALVALDAITDATVTHHMPPRDFHIHDAKGNIPEDVQ